MDILHSLGVDWTLFIHLACFLIAYFFLTTFILKPYMAAHHEREKRTTGSEEMALRLIDEANELELVYEKKARALSSEIKGFFDQSRTHAMEKYDKLVSDARTEAATVLKAAQVGIEREVQQARKTLSEEIPGVSAAIASKLAGKDFNA